MASILQYTLLSVLLISLLSFIGIFTLAINTKKLQKVLIYLISFSAGALLGDAFLHLLPEIVETNGFTTSVSVYTLSGIAIFFILEKIIHWEHAHSHVLKQVHPFAYVSLIGDALHNFLDGIIIAVSYIVSIPVGIATTIAVALHEIPQEIGDFGILLHGGFTKSKAFLLNFSSALFAILGAIITLLIRKSIENIELILVPIAAGGFIYIAASDLIPELHKEKHIVKSLLQLLTFIIGIVVMTLLLLLE